MDIIKEHKLNIIKQLGYAKYINKDNIDYWLAYCINRKVKSYFKTYSLQILVYYGLEVNTYLDDFISYSNYQFCRLFFDKKVFFYCKNYQMFVKWFNYKIKKTLSSYAIEQIKKNKRRLNKKKEIHDSYKKDQLKYNNALQIIYDIDFYNSLSSIQKKYTYFRILGYNQEETAKLLGYNTCYISTKLFKIIKTKYKKYMEDI